MRIRLSAKFILQKEHAFTRRKLGAGVKIITPDRAGQILEGDNVRHTFSCEIGEMLHIMLLDKQDNPCKEAEFKLFPSRGSEGASDISLNTHVPDELWQMVKRVKLTEPTRDLKGM